MHMAIRYLSTFTYDAEVSESQNALRAKPAVTATQRLVSYSVAVDPLARIFSYTDYWGTQVDCFGINERHTRLTVVADSVVETAEPAPPASDAPWPPPPGDDLHFEYTMASPHVTWTEEVAGFGRRATAEAATYLEAVTAVQHAVGDHLTYRSGATEVGIGVAEVFTNRVGVCQDYAHLALALYRSLGVPARYVSGYLYAADASSGETPVEDEVDVSTHAWVEVMVPGHGWWGLDPTNQLAAGERHVKIGHGRDYEDVMPLRGVYHGEAEDGGLAVGVRMSRSRLDPYAMQPRPVYVRRQDQMQRQQ